jgi:hypothetical protein
MAHADTSASDIRKALKQVDFPAGKDELLRSAREAGASEEVLAALRAIPPEQYGNRDEVVRSVRLAPDSDLGHSAAQRAEQAKLGGRPGQSERLREVPKPPVEEELERGDR